MLSLLPGPAIASRYQETLAIRKRCQKFRARLVSGPVDLGVWQDPIYADSPYADNFTTILTFQGTLKPA